MKKDLQKLYGVLGCLLSGIVILISGAYTSVQAQEKKAEKIEKNIIINDSDTIINGKKLSEANKAERKKMLKELEEFDGQMQKRITIRKGGDGKEEEIIIRKGDKEPRVLHWKSEGDKDFELKMDGMPGHIFKMDKDSMIISLNGDSTMRGFRFKLDGVDSNMRSKIITMERMPRMMENLHPKIFMDENFSDMWDGDRKNSQNFSFSNTDNDGITTRMNIRVSSLTKEDLKKVSGTEKSAEELQINDFTIFPNFSSGKLTLSFSLASKGLAEVKLMDSSMKTVFSDQTSGNFLKQISLPLNGIYYLNIKQGNKTWNRKITKQ